MDDRVGMVVHRDRKCSVNVVEVKTESCPAMRANQNGAALRGSVETIVRLSPIWVADFDVRSRILAACRAGEPDITRRSGEFCTFGSRR
jgi:hypothetical protein